MSMLTNKKVLLFFWQKLTSNKWICKQNGTNEGEKEQFHQNNIILGRIQIKSLDKIK